jgi:hypothetical protein
VEVLIGNPPAWVNGHRVTVSEGSHVRVVNVDDPTDWRVLPMESVRPCTVPAAATPPKRVQFHRGMDLGAAVYVGRGGATGGPFGNPFKVKDHGREKAVEMFERHLLGSADLLARVRSELRGRDLACWCKPGDLCHADVLLRIANPTP